MLVGTAALAFDAALLQTLGRAIDTCAYSVSIADAQSPDLPLSYVNPAFEKLTGYASEDVLGRNCRFLQGPDTNPSTVELIGGAIQQKKPCSTMLLNYRKNGTKFWNRFQLSPVFDPSGTLSSYLGIQLDITRDVTSDAVQNERQKIEALGRLAGGVAHELNNAIQPIQLMNDTMADFVDLLPEKERNAAKQCVTVIDMHTKFAGSTVDQILNFSKTSDGTLSDYPVWEKITETVSFAKSLLPSTIQTTIPTTGEIAPVLREATAKINLIGLQQIFANLFTNAAHAMGRQGHIAIGIEHRLVDDVEGSERSILPGDYACITVADSGHGIAPEIVPLIFEPFFTNKPAEEGTGLGLSTVMGILVSWAGTITVHRTSSDGTVFQVFLPIQINGGRFGEHSSN